MKEEQCAESLRACRRAQSGTKVRSDVKGSLLIRGRFPTLLRIDFEHPAPPQGQRQTSTPQVR